jgi:hypothetical protein
MIPFNPLDKTNLGDSVVKALLNTAAHLLPPAEKFTGAGIYAIYYIGSYEPYSPISRANADGKFNQPIYVGNAVPAGSRKGGSLSNISTGSALFQRLQDHEKSIEAAFNLKTSDFRCRYLTVDDIWIPLAESILIDRFSPLLNLNVDGFGNHDPGKGRTGQKKSQWDLLHEGREWAKGLPQDPGKSVDMLEEGVREFLKSRVTATIIV